MTEREQPWIIGPSRVGAGALIAAQVIVGHPSKSRLLGTREFAVSDGATIGERCILRSGTVIYEHAVLSNDVQTAHNVIIREGAQIGEGCVFGNGAVVREHATLGRNVRAMESTVIAEGAVLGDDIFIGPNVSLTAGRFMTGALEASGQLTHDQAKVLEGRYWEGPPIRIGNCVRIGAGAVILAGISLGRGCVVAAGAVISTDVPEGAIVMGNPGRVVRVPARTGGIT